MDLKIYQKQHTYELKNKDALKNEDNLKIDNDLMNGKNILNYKRKRRQCNESSQKEDRMFNSLGSKMVNFYRTDGKHQKMGSHQNESSIKIQEQIEQHF